MSIKMEIYCKAKCGNVFHPDT